MANEDLYLDIRLQEKSMRDGKLGRDALAAALAKLPDAAANVQAFDEDGNPISPPERKLKVLAVKPAEPEPLIKPTPATDDPLSDAWDDR